MNPQMPPKLSLPGVKQVIAVASGKGGVGKSTVAANLAMALHMSGKAVGLMDADIYGPNIPRMMGINVPPDVTERLVAMQASIERIEARVAEMEQGAVAGKD